jgi:hypothetical protein
MSGRLQYTCSIAMGPIDQLVEIAKTAQEVGFDNIVIPWVFDGLAFDCPLDKKQDSLKRFADTYIHSGWQDA